MRSIFHACSEELEFSILSRPWRIASFWKDPPELSQVA